MNIVIAGAGDVGCHLAKMLGGGGHDLTIIDRDPARLATVSSLTDAVTIEGETTSVEILKTARVEDADLFIAVAPAEEQNKNIISALLAKQLGAKIVTARINNNEFMETDNNVLFKDLGIDLLFYPERIAAGEIYDLLKQTGTNEYIEFASGQLQMVGIRLDEGAPLIRKGLDYLSSEAEVTNYKVVAVGRDGATLIPKTEDFKFLEGDLVYIISTRDGLDEAMEYSGKNKIDINSLMIIGGGRICDTLLDRIGDGIGLIKVVENKEERCTWLAQKYPDALIIQGDGRNTDLLIEENIREFDAVVAVTSSSETNILACAAAKRLGVAKTIAEVENIEYIKLAEGMGVDAVINKKLSTAGRIFRFTLSNKIRTVKCLNGTDAEVLEFIANPESRITKGQIKDLNFPKEAIIGGIVRGNDCFITGPSSSVNAYDRVVVFALPNVIDKVNKFFI